MVLLRVWRSYLSVLNRHPTKTQMVQTGLLMGAGDITSQMVVEGKAWGEINRERALRYFLKSTHFLSQKYTLRI